MIIINQSYIDKFKKYNTEYLYQVDKGLYLAFDIDNLSYIDFELYYQAPMQYVNRKVNECIEDLLSRNILELRSDE